MSKRPAASLSVSPISPPSPFARLRALLDSVEPARAPLLLALGAPQHAAPDFVLQAMAQDTVDYEKYPPIGGVAQWRAAVSGWLARRFDIGPDLLADASQILPLNGTREGLFLAAQLAPPKRDGQIAMPNPFYQVYAGAAVAASAAPLYLNATAETGFLPDLDALPNEALHRLRALYLCSPANPQGAVADAAYLRRAYQLARQHQFIILVDECYAEIYDDTPPVSMLQVCQQENDHDAPVMVFHSLSKRSNLAGLRSGFCAGGRTLMQRFHDLRLVVGPQSPLPVQRAAALAWADDAHVAENRAQYRAKFDIADRLLAGYHGYQRPAGGFFLWLACGDGEAMARKLWSDYGVQVLPGAYLAQTDADGSNIGADYIRVAMVAPLGETEDALSRLAVGLDHKVERQKCMRVARQTV